MEKIRRIFEEKGLTEKQIEAGVKYHENFGRYFWPLEKSASKFLKLLREQKEGIPWLTTRREYRLGSKRRT